jgi:D-alanyl-D-alanine carboxypeptidase
MTQRARQLGMTHTRFENASGLPDPDQVTTAHDMALLGRALIADFPAYYPYFSTRSFVFAGHVQTNHNHLLETYDGADGIKTGFIRASGFNLVASAKREGRRLIGVVFGGKTQPERDHQMARLLDQGFAHVADGGQGVANIADATVANTAPGQARLMQLALDGDGDDAPAKPRALAGGPLVLTPGPHRVGPRLASAAPTPPVAAGNWLVQVGAFSGAAQASAASQAAIKSANLYQGQVSVSAAPHGHAKLYRARVVGLAETQAREACRTLTREHKPCVVLGPDGSATH